MDSSRRVFLAGLAASFAARKCRAAESGLKVLNWRHYGTDESWALEAFEARSGLTLTHEYYGTSDDGLARLEKNGDAYDMVVLNASHVPEAVSRGLLQPIPPEAVTAFERIAARLRHHEFLEHDGKLYGLCWTWGMTGLSRRAEKIPAATTHWTDLWNSRFKGRVAIRDDAMDAVRIAALASKQDPAAIDDFGAIEDRLMELKGQIGMIWAGEDDWNQAFAESKFDLSVHWSSAAARAQRFFQMPVAFSEPAEGAIGWFDCLALPADTKRRDGALALIDYLSGDDFLVNWATRVGAPAPANLAALSKLKPDDPTRRIHRPELIDKLIILPSPDEKARATAAEIWTRVSAALRG